MLFQEQLIVIRGAGDLATGVAVRLHRAGFPIVMLELPEPSVVRRTVAFAEAIRKGTVEVEEVVAYHVEDPKEARLLAHKGDVAVMVDPEGQSIPRLRPAVVVDARLAKRNIDTAIDDARFVVGLGPGFTAGKDVHAVVETMRGHDLGRVIWEGGAQPNTGTPGIIKDKAAARVLRAPIAGRVKGHYQIGEVVRRGDTIATIHPSDPTSEPATVVAPFEGLLRGLIADDVEVPAGMKIGDLDPRPDVDTRKISDKALAVGGGVVEAVLTWLSREKSGSGERGAGSGTAVGA
ncbi:MAG: selenium-dependent molybdenum cofactor biosynthesis protein YqeB [Chloroflexota bacterium]|nr:selenium-dependent molybdenum cofactor biosynthesis protein YqeB [Chloroflexota bacterium]